jgi:hypothetical protein
MHHLPRDCKITHCLLIRVRVWVRVGVGLGWAEEENTHILKIVSLSPIKQSKLEDMFELVS